MTENGPDSQHDPPHITQPAVQPTENKTRIPRPMVCKVLLLNGEDYEVAVDKRAVGQLLYERVCDYLDLLERDYFGLLYREDADPENVKYWLDLTKKITKQKKRGKMEFEFALKFYPPDPTQLTESITRYLVSLQVRRDILSGKLPCSQATHAMLGSYAVQADVGDYDPIDHGAGIDYIRDLAFAPEQTDDLLFKIANLHKQHKGQTPEQAELHYLEYSKKIALYGIDLHRAKDSDYVDILIGVGATGISVYRDNLRINRFVWPKILKISYRRNKFLLRIRPAEYETYESWIAFRLPNNRLAKRLWKISVEHHAFLRLRSADDAKKRSGFPRFGSKYRYSGRTLHQTRLNASMADRPSKQFERTHSRQSLNSVLNNNRARSHDNLNTYRGPYYEQRGLDIHNLSFDTAQQERTHVPPVSIESERTPFQSPLPLQESPKFITREVIRQPVSLACEDIDEEEDDLDSRLPPVVKDSPRQERRPISNHQSFGGVATPLSAINLPLQRQDASESENSMSERSQSPRGSLDSIEMVINEKPKAKVPPEVAPKPAKEKPPVAKKPEKPAKPEKPQKPAKPEKPPKAEKSPKPEKPPKAPKPSKKDKGKGKEKDSAKKEPIRELSM